MVSKSSHKKFGYLFSKPNQVSVICLLVPARLSCQCSNLSSVCKNLSISKIESFYLKNISWAENDRSYCKGDGQEQLSDLMIGR
jgi:hypothetical protein